MERQIKIEGQLNPSPAGMQPRAYFTQGRALYHLECSACGLRTAKLPTMQEAVAAWETITSGVTA